MNANEVLSIAAVVRRQCDLWNQEKGAFPPCLNGMCAIASHYLYKILRKHGYTPRFNIAMAKEGNIWGGSHCWTSVGRLHIDITATQFAPVSPVYHYRGTKAEHPLLKRFHGKEMHRRDCFPQGFMLYSANAEEQIVKLLDGWNPEEMLSDAQALQLESMT